MYIRRIEIENNGPIGYFSFEFPFSEEENPKPVLFVGQNGAGKSILLSHIVNGMVAAKGQVFDDSEVEQGKVYKIRSPVYVKHDKDFSRAYVYLDDGFYQGEIQCRINKKDFEATKGYTPIDANWGKMEDNQSSIITSNFHEREDELRQKLSRFGHLYFPANRFEEPAWLNAENLKNTATYSETARLHRSSGRNIINYSPLKENQNWLLDVIYDSLAIERRMAQVPVGQPPVNLPFLIQDDGPATKLRRAIEEFLLNLLGGERPINWSVGGRGRRSISLNGNGKVLTPNLFSLSTGQTALLDIFLTIMRDYDTSYAQFESLAEIRSTVVIDEIDLHLHTELQYTILPQLVALFPKVQFIITTHSPLFIMGLEKVLSNDGFDLIDLPSGDRVSVERFSEFEEAYRYFKKSAIFGADVQNAIIEDQTPILFVEGTIDIDYINRAAELLGRKDSVNHFRMLDANGYGGLDKLWKHFDTNIAELTNRRVTLLYDCDVNKQDGSKPGVARIVMPCLQRRIQKGIENLLPDELMEKAKHENPAYIDVTPSFERTVRGQVLLEPELWEANKDEKRRLADWVIANASANDLADFGSLFDKLDDAFNSL